MRRCRASEQITVLTDTGVGLTWDVPANWSNAKNSVELIGGGGGGPNGDGSNGRGGGARNGTGATGGQGIIVIRYTP